MSATDLHNEQRARLPTDYIGGTCEGRQASPSNPNRTRASGVKEGLSESVIFRCTPSEKAVLLASWFWTGLMARSEMTRLGLTRIEQAGQIWVTLDPDRTELKTCTMAGTPVICIEIKEP